MKKLAYCYLVLGVLVLGMFLSLPPAHAPRAEAQTGVATFFDTSKYPNLQPVSGDIMIFAHTGTPRTCTVDQLTNGSFPVRIIGTPPYYTQLASSANTSNKTMTFPNVSGNIVSTGDTATVTNTMLVSPTTLTRVVSPATNATASMTNLTNLSQTIATGGKYTGELVLYANNSTAVEGLQFDFNGGSAAMTSFEAGFAALPPGSGLVLGTLTTTAIGTPLTATTATTGDAVYTIQVTIVCSTGGTLIPRFAEVSHTSGTATVQGGSWLRLTPSSN